FPLLYLFTLACLITLLVPPVSIHTHMQLLFAFFLFNTPSPPEIYTLSLHDALPISGGVQFSSMTSARSASVRVSAYSDTLTDAEDRKSTRLNSSHVSISYAVFCLKKKKKKTHNKHADQYTHNKTMTPDNTRMILLLT